MKKVFAVLAIMGVALLGTTSAVFAQDEVVEDQATEQVAEEPAQEEAPAQEPAPQAKVEEPKAQVATNEGNAPGEQSMHKALKTKFIEGGAGFMACVVVCLIIGLALAIERIIYLSLASINTKALLDKIEDAMENGDVEGAKDIARNTRGPIASIFYQGLSRVEEGADAVEKSVVSYGGVQMGLLEKNVTWISLCIALAPMLGFMGTVIGMIQAFDKIQQVGDISATVVAGGIKVALLTTVTGLIVAMILQVFLNFILTKIEALTTDMEDSSISLLDIVVKYEQSRK